MRSIYSQCILNISVSCSSNPEEGAFRDRDPGLLDPIYVPSSSFAPWALITFEDDMISHLLNHPLANRGWVVQERFLSPRVLYFGRDRIYWQCLRHTASENYPTHCREKPFYKQASSKPRDVNVETTFQHESFSLSLRLLAMDHTHSSYQMECTRAWLQFVELYTTTALSFSNEDKLAAIEGVAQHFHNLVPDSGYIERVFTHNLPFGLLWGIRQNQHVSASLSRAPSWSWVNSNSGVEFYKRIYKTTFDVLLSTSRFVLVDGVNIKGPFHQLHLRGFVENLEDAYASGGQLLLRFDDGSFQYQFESEELQLFNERKYSILPIMLVCEKIEPSVVVSGVIAGLIVQS